MLRFFVLTLVLLNAVYFAWSQELLKVFNFAPTQQAEPQRRGLQIKPEAIRLLTAQELSQTAAAEAVPRVAPKPAVCLQAGLFDETQGAALRSALEPALAPGSWSLEPAALPARWIVYLGKYASAQAVARKRSELASLNLRFEPLINPALEWGLSLGGFETQAAANAELLALNRRGVRTARVVQERAEEPGLLLRLPGADDALRARLEELKPALAGKALETCQ